MNLPFPRLLPSIVLVWALVADGSRCEAASPPSLHPDGLGLTVRACLAVRTRGGARRSCVHVDPVEHALASGRWSAPAPDQELVLADGSRQVWKKLRAGDGAFEGLDGGYADLVVESVREQVVLLGSSGASRCFVNGTPRVGDVYDRGFVRLPVKLERGTNHLLFECRRGKLKVAFEPAKPHLMLDPADSTLPDEIVGRATDSVGALVVLNPTGAFSSGHSIETRVEGAAPASCEIPSIPPYGLRKVRILLRAPARTTEGTSRVTVRLLERGRPIDEARVELGVRLASHCHKRTFVSGIDGSVQYFAVTPPPIPEGKNRGLALFLSLHGASVEASGHAGAYSPKAWGTIVCPTNRRPYGFDWEDTGRADAMEVLAIARDTFAPDPARIYLTGHSMGGHGTYQIGALFPGLFAALGPSAGWISFDTYRGAEHASGRTGVDEILCRARSPSDTAALCRNYASTGLCILHGAADDEVPVTESRQMVRLLRGFHRDFVYHEVPGQKHWWDLSSRPGVDCLDWAPTFDFFARHTLPADDRVGEIAFSTPSPGIASRCRWLEIEAQQHPLRLATVRVACDPGRRRVAGTTENVARLSLDPVPIPPGAPVAIELDGQTIAGVPYPARGARIRLGRVAGQWALAGEAPASRKGPARYGPFKEVFGRRVVFVVGTGGTPEENAWALAKARYDAEAFWYRGNGSVDVVPDQEFAPGVDRDRNVLLYGNADTNRAWAGLLRDSPVQVGKGRVRVGATELAGDHLACVFVRPRPDSAFALVGAVAPTGTVGMRLADGLPYFVSGAGFPDWIVFSVDSLLHGSRGVPGAGFFGLDWRVESGDLAWQPDPGPRPR